MEIVECKLEENEFQKIRSIVYETAGISLADSKRALVVSRLARRLQQLKVSSFQGYIHLLESDPNEIHLMINRITTNLTKFYREKHQFDVLRQRILPQILESKKKNRQKTIRIWSAGCSTGEEVYTILFEVLKAGNGRSLVRHPLSFDLKILGSDIDTNVLKKARSARYSDEEIKGLEKNVLEKYFDRVSPGEYQLKEKLGKFVGFRRINLVHDDFSFKHKIDIIFCRNVVIYFDNETRQKVYEKFHAALNSPGFFFSGHSENLFKYKHVFKFVEKSIYKKVVL
jgi:chemotaxis protein methyltransferase CheR